MREIKFEYGFESTNGIVKKVYALSEIPNISHKCDVWNILPIIYVRQYTGLKDKNGVEIYDGDIIKYTGKKYSDDTPAVIVYSGTGFCSKCIVTGDLGDLYGFEVKVIGNIHEK